MVVQALLIKGILHDSTSSELVANKAFHDCPGAVELPTELDEQFEAIEDEVLLSAVLGMPKAGMLCQCKVYRAAF